MDFSALPDHVILEIFRYLPLVDRVRSGRVDRTFRRMSATAITQLTKSLDLWDYYFISFTDPLTPRSMIVLLNLCADRLEEIRFGFDHDHEIPFMQAFGQQAFRCPNLTKLQCSVGDAAILRPILSNCPNLSTLDVKAKIRFPADEIATSETLETLIIGRCDEDDLRSLIGRVPNLRHLKLADRDAWIESAATTLDRLLSTVPKLETLEMNGLAGELEEDFNHGAGRVGSFWRLNRLRSLKAYDFHVDDNTSKKVAESFPAMLVLNVSARDSFTSAGLTWLSSLRELRDLNLAFDFEDEPRDLSTGVLSLANKCAQLRTLVLGYSSVQLSPSVISQLFHSCRRLDLLDLWDLAVEPPEPDQATDQAAAVLQIALFFVRSLAGLGARQIRITFFNNNTEERRNVIRGDIWRSKAVEEALERLKREEGTVVEINAPFEGYNDDDEEQYC